MRSIGMKLVVIGSILGLMAACTSESSSTPKRVLGTDNRQIESNAHLSQTVGSLRMQDGGLICNGFFTGVDEITTAEHCVPQNQARTELELSGLYFESAAGEKSAVESVLELNPRKDFARLKVARSAGEFLEKATIKNSDLSLVSVNPGSLHLETDRSCKHEQTIASAGAFVHNCDSEAGVSGAPLLQNGAVVGIHIGYKARIDRNVATDFRFANSSDADVLALDYTREGCHSRMEISWDHTRLHVRDCTPSPADLVSGRTKDCMSDVLGAAAATEACFVCMGAAIASGGAPTVMCVAFCGGSLISLDNAYDQCK